MKNKEEFTRGILGIAKSNLERDGYLLQMLFLDTDRGMIAAGLVGIESKNDMRETLAHMGKEFAKNGTKINTIYLLSDATLRSFPMEMKDLLMEGKINMKDAASVTDTIIIAEWDLTNDYQVAISQHYHTDNKKVVFDGKPFKMENPVINMLDSFVENYRALKARR